MGRAETQPRAMTVKRARAAGLLIDEVPLDAIDTDYLVRDRLVQDEDELTSLKVSIQGRGQQMPIEVVALDKEDGRFDYGLISGWRRLTAMRQLHAETRDSRFANIKALVISPDTAQSAYRSMIEENEIRVNLSHYERARVALRAVHEGVFQDQRAALRGLFGAATRSKRSKIGTFMSLVHAFDGVLQHPTAISEKMGLALVREMIRDPDLAETISDLLRNAPSRTAPEEQRILAKALEKSQAANSQTTPTTETVRAHRDPRPGPEIIGAYSVRFNSKKAQLSVSGPDVDEAFVDAFKLWLSTRS